MVILFHPRQYIVVLNNTFYKGETKAFSFEKYVAKHLEAHRLLFEVRYNSGNVMENAMKIQHF